MANNYSGSLPHFPHGVDQQPIAKMPGAMPNGAPPQWGQEVDFKSNLTSQIPPHVHATNGTRSSSQHSHPGSLSSHSSRDSSPAPSRIGVVHPNAWSTSNSYNHSNLVPNDNPSSISNRAQQPSQHSPFNSGGPTVTNHSASPGQGPPSNFQSPAAQRMPPVGQVPPGPQQVAPGAFPPSQQRPQGTATSTSLSTLGQLAPQVSDAVNSSASHSASHMPSGNPLFTSASSSLAQGQQAQGNLLGPSSSSGVQQPNAYGSPAQYSQAPSHQVGTPGQQQSGPNQGSPRPTGQAFPMPGPLRTVGTTPTSSAHVSPMPAVSAPMSSGRPMPPVTGHPTPPGAGQQMPPGAGQQMPPGAGQQMPPGAGQQMPPGAGQQMTPMPGQQMSSMMGPKPPAPGQQMQPGFGQTVPLGPGQNVPPQMQPGFNHQVPPGAGQQMPPGRVPPMPPMSGAPLGQMPPMSGAPLGQMPPMSGAPLGQMPPMSGAPPGQMPPMSGAPPGQMPPMSSALPGQMPPMAGAPPGQMPPMSGAPLGQMPPRQMPPGPGLYPQRPLQGPPQGPALGQPQSSPQGPPLGPGQGPPPQMAAGPPGQWPAGPTAGGLPTRPVYPMHQGLATSPAGSQPFPGQPPMSMPNHMPQLNQSLSGPGQYMPNAGQQMAPGPVAANDTGFRRYPQQQMHPAGPDSLTSPMSNLSVTQSGYNKLWGQENYDLLQSRNILPPEKVEAPKIRLTADFQNSVNCSPDIFRCTLTRIPETDSLLKKSRLPLGVLIHPFRDLQNLPVIQCTPIVRCRMCRTYINPFVYFMDEKHWKCNLCFRVNELPDEFQYDPATKTYGEPMRRPEVKSATIEFIAPAEYMLRPPQPAVYLFLLDVSRLAVESGYLQVVCETLLSQLEQLPGDGRTSVGFITYDSAVHFYSLAEGLSAPQQMVVMDIDEIFLPCPENLLANLGERKELIQNLLLLLPTKFSEQYDTGSALGAALQAAFKLMSPTGGRVTVFQCCLPNKGPGTLKAREDPANRASKDVPHLNPATDFYKQLALEFSGQQTAVDLFLLNQQYSDLATISGVSRFSGGCIYHFPLFQSSNIQLCDSFETAFRRYLERKIGFEAVMRIRCSRGLSIHTFHGNFYVRSTDLLSLPNINPDAGFGMQVSIEENLSDMQTVCFQAALLYTSGKGERRIRVHTLCLPTGNSLPDILHSADQQCIIGLLAKMAVDRSQQSSLSDARDAFINVAIDALSAYKLTQSSVTGAGLLAPRSLRLLPLYIIALLKNMAFRSGTTTRLDDRVYAMCQMKTLPLTNLIQFIYPDMYPVYALDQYAEVMIEDTPITIPPRLHLSAEKISSQGAFLLDAGDQMFLLVGRAIPALFCENVLGVSSFNAIPEDMFELPEIDCEDSRRLRNFVSYLQTEKAYCATLQVIREDSKQRSKFFERLIEDRTDSSLSYYEFLQHIKNQIK